MEQSKSPTENSTRPSNIYKNPCLIPILNQMYKDRNETGDVKFIVDSEEISAHRYVLAALSPKYKAQFYGSHRDSGDIKVENVSAAAFNEFLQFFYIEDVSLTIENIEDVLNLAEQSLAENLVNLCKKFLMDTVELGRISVYIRLACLYNLQELENACDDIININVHELLKSSDFHEYDRDTLIYILKLDTLNCKETEVFEACMEWARAECKRQNIDHSNATILRTALGDAFYNIRFCLMPIQELTFIDIQHPNIFKKTELNEVLQKQNDSELDLFNKNPRIYSCCVANDSAESFIPSYGRDGIAFSCNKPIDLYGFNVCAGPCDKFNVAINDGSILIRDCPKIIRKSNQHLKVMFEKPVRLWPNQTYKPGIIIKFPENVTQTGHYPLAETEQHDICFKFCKIGGGRTTISRLLFNHINLV